MICAKCGKEIEDGRAFCGYCGKKYKVKQSRVEKATPKVLIIVLSIFVLGIALLLGGFFLYMDYFRPLSVYKQGLSYFDYGYYDEARDLFAGIAEFKDSREMVDECSYQKALKLYNDNAYDDAKGIFSSIYGHKDSGTWVKECDYQKATELLGNKKVDEAKDLFNSLGDYKDASDMVKECIYRKIIAMYGDKKLWEGGNVEHYFASLATLGKYRDCDKLIFEKRYEGITNLIEEKNFDKALTWCEAILDYEDGVDIIIDCYNKAVADKVSHEDYAKAFAYCDGIRAYDNYEYENTFVLICESASLSGEAAVQCEDWKTAKEFYSFLSDIEYENTRGMAEETISLILSLKEASAMMIVSLDEMIAKEEANAKAKAAKEQEIWNAISGTWTKTNGVIKVKNKKWGYYVDERNWKDFKWAGLDDKITYSGGVYYLYNDFWGKTYSATISGNKLTLKLYKDNDPYYSEMGYVGTYIKTSNSID